MKKLQELATQLGATLSEPIYSERGQSYEVELFAPEGKQWKFNGCAFMGGMYWPYIKGHKAKCYETLFNQAQQGVEDLDHEL
jgi:hypothetical protein